VALTITASLVLGTLGAVGPAAAAPSSTGVPASVATTVTAPVEAGPAATITAPTVLAAPAKTSVTGVVRAHTTKGTAPLAGVYVRAFTGTGTNAVYAVTDATGAYSLQGLAAGSYKVSYNSYSTSAGFVFAEQFWKNKNFEAEATPIKVGGSNLSGYDVTLQQGSTITGTLTMKVGTKSAPAQSVRKVTTYLNGSKTGVERYVSVDAKGKYSITGLVAGSYKLSFGVVGAKTGLRGEFYNNATTLAASKSITVAFAQSLTGINAELAGTPDLVVSVGVYGDTTVGGTLTGYVYSSPTASSTTYQWYRNGVAISGASKITYRLVGADAGKTITLKAKAAKTGYTSSVGVGQPWNTIALGTFQASPPSIKGAAKVGATLTAVPGPTVPTPSALTYTWFRSGSPITGATASTYKITAADKGFTLSVRTTAKATGYTTLTRGSSSTVPVTLP